MLNHKLINYFKSKSWWYDDSSDEYENALITFNVDLNSDFAKFYLHVEDGPTFLSQHFELLHLPWFIQNTDYSLLLSTAQKAFKLEKNFLPVTNLEAESCYFYNMSTQEVILLETGSFQDNPTSRWGSWSEFLLWYFEL